MRTIAVIALGSSLAGCAVYQAKVAQDARGELIGKSAAEITACAGVPSGRFSQGEQDILSYHYDGGFVGESTLHQCTANFVFQKGRLTSLNYRSGGTGLLTHNAICARIIENCVP